MRPTINLRARADTRRYVSSIFFKRGQRLPRGESSRASDTRYTAGGISGREISDRLVIRLAVFPDFPDRRRTFSGFSPLPLPPSPPPALWQLPACRRTAESAKQRTVKAIPRYPHPPLPLNLVYFVSTFSISFIKCFFCAPSFPSDPQNESRNFTIVSYRRLRHQSVVRRDLKNLAAYIAPYRYNILLDEF